MANGQRGQYAAIAPEDAKRYIVTKNCDKFLYFTAQNPTREAYSDHSRVRSAPPTGMPPKQIPGYPSDLEVCNRCLCTATTSTTRKIRTRPPLNSRPRVTPSSSSTASPTGCMKVRPNLPCSMMSLCQFITSHGGATCQNLWVGKISPSTSYPLPSLLPFFPFRPLRRRPLK